MSDRSISALRTLRPEVDKDIFWFRDDLHQPYPISPMGMTTVQRHHAFGYHVAADEMKFPPSKGAHVKIYKGRVYLGYALIHDEQEVADRGKPFGEYLAKVVADWNGFYGGYIDEVKAGNAKMKGFDTANASWSELLAQVNEADEINRRNWEIHFILMYPADTLYLQFEEFAQKYGLLEKDFITMLKGFDGAPARTDEELWKLTLKADELGLKPLFTGTDADKLLEALKARKEAAPWLKAFDAFLREYGNRINAAHLDVMFSTWIEDPTPVLDTIKSYYKRMDDGWDYYEAKKAVFKERDDAIQKFESRLDKKEKAEFDRMLDIGQNVYSYQEDHGFYIDQGSTAALHDVLKGAGARLTKVGLLNEPDDVFYLTVNELRELIGDLARNHEDIVVYHHVGLTLPLVEERKAAWVEAKQGDAPLTVGAVPKTMTDPLAVKVFGIVDEVLHPKGETVVADNLEGFAGAPGLVEGPARVVTEFADFQSVQSGEILIAPYTGTAWTPLFLKIGGVVTDTGGMLTHAAIAAREYGIPAVVGTWNATNSINNGDIVRVDGNNGTVDVVRRVS